MLHVSTNNRADTALNSFCGAVHEYGVPSSVRVDDGSEFRHINLMIDLNGDDRASHIVGQSVHNAGVDHEILQRDSTLCQPP